MKVASKPGLRFLTDSLAIYARVAGNILAAVNIYDGRLDPAVGARRDWFRRNWGRRLPFLFAGGLAMPVGWALLFGTQWRARLAWAHRPFRLLAFAYIFPAVRCRAP
jgi:Na+/melibiose symporter-like transporter